MTGMPLTLYDTKTHAQIPHGLVTALGGSHADGPSPGRDQVPQQPDRLLDGHDRADRLNGGGVRKDGPATKRLREMGWVEVEAG